MKFIDTHTHLYLDDFEDDRAMIFSRMLHAGVDRVLLPNIDSSSIAPLKKTCAEFPAICYPMMGLHPTSVKENFEDELNTIKLELDHGNYFAIGEIGIDLYWDKSFKQQQEIAFREQIKWAIEKSLPIVIHARDSFTEIFEIIDDVNCEELKGVFHCFTGTAEDAARIINYGGFKMGLGGVLTFKNAKLDKAIGGLELKHFVLETDSPFLAPTPHRGKRNESSYIPLIAEKLAQISALSIEDVARITTNNAIELFNLKQNDH